MKCNVLKKCPKEAVYFYIGKDKSKRGYGCACDEHSTKSLTGLIDLGWEEVTKDEYLTHEVLMR